MLITPSLPRTAAPLSRLFPLTPICARQAPKLSEEWSASHRGKQFGPRLIDRGENGTAQHGTAADAPVHRHPVAQSVVLALLAARPDAVIVEMGLPVWRPPAQAYLVTFGATRASSLAAAEVLGLASGPT